MTEHQLIGRVLVVIPTYQEANNIESVVRRTLATVPSAHVLVVDDASPDGTGRIAASLSAAEDRVHVLHRAGKQGLGAAYLAGFSWAVAARYDAVVEMDADGSHLPEQLPRLLEALDEGADLVLGSRWVPGGAVRNWPYRRQLLSRAGNRYVRTALGIPLRDATGGYRAFRRSTLQQLSLSQVGSQGYCFQVELAWRAVQAGLDVREVPITFVERQSGTSKMTGAVVGEALWRVTMWGTQRRLHRRGKVRAATGGHGRWDPRRSAPLLPRASEAATPERLAS